MVLSLQFEDPWQSSESLLQRRGDTLSELSCAALVCSDSLTMALEELYGAPVTLRQVRQGEPPEQMADADSLWRDGPPSPEGDEILARQAWLDVGGIAQVFAHSELSGALFSPTLRRDLSLGETPLGMMFLDRDRPVTRHALELARARVPQVAMALGVAEETLFWCRRSLFRVDGESCGRIVEIFLTVA
ncbi:MAG: DUF98 domain-containing protein [Magnetococcales bacterium]|nr:DUF98 domain-containing protein [Magnetococcales bacterium]